MCGVEYDKNPWGPVVMTITLKLILLQRVSVYDGKNSKCVCKVFDGMELLQIQGFDHKYLKGPIPESGFATQLAGNAFNAFMVQAFLVSTTIASTIQDDVPGGEAQEDDDGGGGSSQSYESYSDGEGDC